MENLYSLLGVSNFADKSTIRSALKEKENIYKSSNCTESDVYEFENAICAASILMNPNKKERFDKALTNGRLEDLVIEEFDYIEFKINDNYIRFNDDQNNSIQMFSWLFPIVYDLIYSNRERIFDYHAFKYDPPKYDIFDNEYNPFIEGLSKIDEKLEELSNSIIGELTLWLNQNKIYEYNVDELSENVKYCFTDAFDFLMFGEVKDSNWHNAKMFIKDVRNNYYGFDYLLVKDICFDIMIMLYEYILEPEEDPYDNLYFEYDALCPSNKNTTQNKRENIQRVGVNINNLEVLISTLEDDPFNACFYHTLLKMIGDKEQQIHKMYFYVFGQTDSLDKNKQFLVLNAIDSYCGMKVDKKILKCKDIATLEQIEEKYKTIKKYYGFDKQLNLDQLFVDQKERITKFIKNKEMTHDKQRNISPPPIPRSVSKPNVNDKGNINISRIKEIAEHRFVAIKKIFQDKDYRHFVCPNCSQILRVPKGKGDIEVTCPMCHNSFEKKS